MDAGVPRRRRARPVVDAPLDPLLARVEDLAKGWLLALVEQLPLAHASTVEAAGVARDGPRVCDAVIRALADDTELRRLRPGGALELLASRAGEMSGAADAATISGVIDALHGVLWSALRRELVDPEPEQVSELAERLGLVIEAVRETALHGATPSEPEGVAPTEEGAPTAGATPPEESAPAESVTPPERRAPTEEVTPPEHEPQLIERSPLAAAEFPRRARGAAALWISALEEEVARATRAGGSLALLIAELEESERMAMIESPGIATATIGRFAQAIRDTVRRRDILAAETESRVWIIARDTGRSGAQALASRVARSVRGAEPWRGAPLTIAIGIAILGEDGRDAESLVTAAEESRFAAAASGVPVVVAGEGER